MNYEKLVLQSAKPLEGKVSDGRKFYLIAAGCGLGLGIVLSLVGGVINIGGWLFFALLTTLIGWGFRNKQLKYKCFGLRNMRFMADEKPSGQELYQKLLPVSAPLNIKLEVTKNGNLSVLQDDVYYDVIFNADDTFSLYWHQNFGKALLRGGYYIKLYKKALVSMGIIAYHIQQICASYDNPVMEQNDYGRICKICGSEIIDDAKFCVHCGMQLE